MIPAACWIDTFPALEKIPHCRAAFLAKQPGIDVRTDKDDVLLRIKAGHHQAMVELGLSGLSVATAKQVHGNAVALVEPPVLSQPYADADALITASRGVCLKIFVADCAAVYLVDRHARGIGLIHSGRKGTELKIVPTVIRKMQRAFGVPPEDLVVQISPCIRPPHYEVDFAADILHQVLTAGVKEVTDCKFCTACHPEHYYSYRMEKGKTGRMAALLALI